MAAAIVSAGSGILSVAGAARAQSRRVRIAVLYTEREVDAVRRGIPDALRAGLLERGYSEDRNLELLWRYANSRYEQLPQIGIEMAALKPDILVTHSSQGLRALSSATRTIPIVAQSTNDPVALGVAASLSKPGGNVTGSTFFFEEVAVKRLQMLKEINPKLSRVAINVVKDNPSNANLLKALNAAARQLKVDLHRIEIADFPEMNAAMAEAARAGVGAIALIEHPRFLSNAKALASLAASNRMLAVGFDGYCDAGGAIEFGIDFLELWRRVGYFVDRIVKGSAAGDIPIEQPTKFNFIVNRRVLSAQGFRIPESLLVRANRIID